MSRLNAGAVLKVRIVKKRRDLTVDVSFDLEKGDSLALFGASGAGKSTILACLAGIEEPDEGCVKMGDMQFFPPSLPLHIRQVGYLNQEPSLFPHLRVSENVCFGLSNGLAKDGEQTSWIETLRDRLQLAPLWHASAALISGGQARRVALARMLAPKPQLVLLDEPFTGLDRQLVRELIDSLVFWNRKLGFTLIAVDHQAEVLRRLCPGQVIAIERGEIIQRGNWDELYNSPATPLLSSLLAPL